MLEIVKLGIGILILLLGFPIGSYLAKATKEELKSGQKWFKLIIITSLVGGIIGLIMGNDIFLFSFFFIAIVTSRCLNKKKK
jgi:formate hydrogenlyase subunit 3/multisubunit Na+/H+ antiporter MnhD subunit